MSKVTITIISNSVRCLDLDYVKSEEGIHFTHNGEVLGYLPYVRKNYRLQITPETANKAGTYRTVSQVGFWEMSELLKKNGILQPHETLSSFDSEYLLSGNCTSSRKRRGRDYAEEEVY